MEGSGQGRCGGVRQSGEDIPNSNMETVEFDMDSTTNCPFRPWSLLNFS